LAIELGHAPAAVSVDEGLAFFAGEFTDGAGAAGQSFEDGIAPARGQEWGDFCVDGFVGLGEVAEILAGGRGGEFFDGDDEIDVYAAYAFLVRE